MKKSGLLFQKTERKLQKVFLGIDIFEDSWFYSDGKYKEEDLEAIECSLTTTEVE